MENGVIFLEKGISLELDELIKFSHSRDWLIKNSTFIIDGMAIIPFMMHGLLYVFVVNTNKPSNKLVFHLSNYFVLLSTMTNYSENKALSVLKNNEEIILNSIKEKLA